MHPDFAHALLDWYRANARALPWRDASDPYAIWVSEVMLQQTRIQVVLERYPQFLAAYPCVEALALASEEDVLRLWQGMGYYTRARNLHKGARYVMANCGGELPADPVALRKVPGVGDYTAGAILSIAFGLPIPAIDGNVLRVMARLLCIQSPVDAPAVRREIRASVEQTLRTLPLPAGPGAFNQGIMELGQRICLPGAPNCAACPLSRVCAARALGIQQTLPQRTPKARRSEWDVWALLARQGDAVWMRRRPRTGILAGMWEFPTVTLPAGAPFPDLTDSWGVASFPPPAQCFTHVLTHRLWHVRGCVTREPVHPPNGVLLPLQDALAKPLPTCMRKLLPLLESPR